MKTTQKLKQTEIGEIPEDWEIGPFTKFAELRHGFQFRDEHFSKDGIAIIKIGNLVDGGGLNLFHITYIPHKDYKIFSKYSLKEGDVLMALTGATLGKISVVNTSQVILQNYRVGMFMNKFDVVKKYIYYLLQSDYIQKK